MTETGGRAKSRIRREWLERLTLVAFDLAAFAMGLHLAHRLYLSTPLEDENTQTRKEQT